MIIVFNESLYVYNFNTHFFMSLFVYKLCQEQSHFFTYCSFSKNHVWCMLSSFLNRSRNKTKQKNCPRKFGILT